MAFLTTYGLSMAIFCACMVIIWALRRLVFSRLKDLVTRNDNTFSPPLLAKTLFPLQVLLFFIALGLSMSPLQMRPEVERYTSLALLLIGVFFAVGFAFGLASFLLDAHLKRSGGDLSGFRGRTIMPVAKALVIVIASAFLLDNLGFKVTSIVTGLGILGVAVGLAGQALLADFFGHFAILLDRPFGLGDYITTGEYQGTVEYIGLKSTRIRSLSGERIVLPNAWLAKAVIRNYNDMPLRRHQFSFIVALDSPPDKLALIPPMVEELVNGEEKAVFERTHLKNTTPLGLEFEVVMFIRGNDYQTFMDVNQNVQLGLFRKLGELSVELARPVPSYLPDAF